MTDKTTNRRPLAQVPPSVLPCQLRIDAEELSGCGAGNEAEHARQAADEIERLRLIIRRINLQAQVSKAYRPIAALVREALNA